MNIGIPEGLFEDGTIQSCKLLLAVVVRYGLAKLRQAVRGRMEINFGNSGRKLLKKTEDQIQVHVSAVIHAEDEMIRAHLRPAELFFQDGKPRK